MSNYTANNEESSLRIFMPSKREWYLVPFFLLWLFLLVVFGFSIITVFSVFVYGILKTIVIDLQDISSASTFAILAICLLPYLMIWLLLGYIGIRNVLWQLTGKEFIEVNQKTMVVTRQLLRWQSRRQYQVKDISDLRSNFPKHFSVGWFRSFYSELRGNYGKIAFEYQEKTYRIGQYIKRRDVEKVLELIQNQLLLDK